MLKVVIDTKVFISAFYLPESRPAEAVLWARRKRVLNFISRGKGRLGRLKISEIRKPSSWKFWNAKGISPRLTLPRLGGSIKDR
jgi:hypothetical protein